MYSGPYVHVVNVVKTPGLELDLRPNRTKVNDLFVI